MVELLEPAIESLGYELTDLECSLNRGNGLVRLFIDRDEGIALEDCELVSRQVSALLDVEDPIGGDYTLEVSSPGVDRKLVKHEHFDRFAGCAVKIRLKRLVQGRRRISGTLLRREDDNVVVQLGDSDLLIPIAEIEVARLVPEL